MKIVQLLFIILISTFFSLEAFSQCTTNAGADTTICIGSSITIGGASTGDGPLTYVWSPSTGLSCTNCPNPVATPITTTSYSVSITDTNGCVASDNITVTIAQLPDASFNFLPNNVCANTPIAFSSNANIAGNTYTWNFDNPASGGNNIAHSANSTHKFVSYGASSQTFNVTLTVTTPNGCSSSTTQSVTINSLPQAQLTDPMSSFKNCDGTNFDMQVFDVTTYPGTNYQIIWGDGTPDFNSPTSPGSFNHTYTTADVFDMYFIVTGTNGCIDTAHYIVSNITNPAIGAANPGATTGCGPLTLCFPLSSYSANHPSTIYIIDYGDDTPVDTITHSNLPPQVCHSYSKSSCGEPGNAFTFEIQAVNQCDISIASINPIRLYTGPQPDFSNPPRACLNSAVLFTNNTIEGRNTTCQSATIYTWDFGDGTPNLVTPFKTNPSHTYTTPGTYTITLSTQNSCGTYTNSHIICIEPAPAPVFTLTPGIACVPFTANVVNTSDITDMCQYSLNWQLTNYSTTCPASQSFSFANATNASSWEPQFTFSSAGDYTIRLSLSNSCGTFYKDTIIKAQDVPQIILPTVGPICEEQSITPTVTVNDCYAPVTSYNWSLPSGTPSSSSLAAPGSITYSNAGNYTVGVAVTNVCGTVNASTPLVVFAPPVADAGPDVSYCSGSSVSLGTTPPESGVSYQWSPTTNLSSSNQSSTIANPSNLGDVPIGITYVLTASTSPVCLSRDTVVVTVNPIPNLTVNSPTICFGDNTQLTVTATTSPMNFAWNASPDLSCTLCDNPTTSPSSTTSYTVVATNQYGCLDSIQSTVTVNPLPIVNAGADQTVCDQPIAFTLSGTPAGGSWSGSANVTAAGVFTPNGPEIANLVYSFTNPSTGCENTDTVIITVVPPVTPTFNPTQEICVNGGNVNLTTLYAPNPSTGLWSGTGVSGATFNPTTAGVGTHTLTYTYGLGTCQVTPTVSIVVNPNPIITASGGTICLGDTMSLTASGAGINGTYQWTPATGLSCDDCDNPFANPSTTTIYTIVGTNEFSCSSTTTATVSVNPLPIVNAGADQTICDQPIAFTLTGTPAGGSWSGSINVTAAGVFTPNGPEIASLVYSFTNPSTGCENTDTVIITVEPPVTPVFNPTQEVCVNSGNVNLTTLYAPNPSTGSWSGTGVSGITFNPTTAGVGTHTLTYTYGLGTCQVAPTVAIVVNPIPTITTSGGTICLGDTMSLTASGAGINGTYQWTPAAGLSCDDCENPFANPSTTTIYTIVGTNEFSCSSTTTTTVTVNPLPIVNAGADTTICNQPLGVQFNATPIGGSWSGTGVTPSGLFTPTTPGVFTLTYTYIIASTGCQNFDNKVVTVVDPTIADAGLDREICIDNSTVPVSGTPVGGIWSGLNVDGLGSFSIATAGDFELIYTNGQGNCLTRDTMTFTVHPLPIVDAGVDLEFCSSEQPVTLVAQPLNGIYSGTGITNITTGEFDPSIAGVGSHTITYTYTDPVTTCVNSDQLVIEVRPLPVVDFTVDSIVCLNTSVPFANLSTFIHQSHWNFGDGTTSTDQNPTHSYTTSGTYTTQLIVTSQYGCKDSITKSVTVYVPPVVNFDVTPDSLCGPLTATFTNNSTGPDMTYSWDFGNGTTSTIANPSPITYPAGIITDTSYTITLTISNYCGQVSAQNTVIVMPLPVSVFGTEFNSFCSPWTPNIANTSYGLPDSYFWDFGNGTSSTTSDSLFQLPVYTTGSTSTNYTIMLVVSNECGIDTAYHIITVEPNTVNSFFNTSTVEGCESLTVDFTQYTLGSTNYHWDFGDGNISSTYSPTHTYTQAGTYNVSLMANNGCSYDTTTVSILVHPSPIAAFIHQPDSVCSFSPINFINQSDPLANYHWDFGDGQTSSLTNPTHIYSNTGDYTVTLTGTSLDGFCTASATSSIHINVPPVANFSFTPQNGCVPLDVQFTNQSSGHAYSYWDFGDGNTSVTNNPQHNYTSAGNYTVKLIVQGINGCLDTMAQFVNVNPLPIANFSYQPSTIICGPNLQVQFTNQSVGAVGYQWSFGDGGTSNNTVPSHNYLAIGTYTIQLIATNQFGCIDTATQQITINQTPQASFSASSLLGCENSPIHFTSSSIDADSIIWNFGNGATATGTATSYNYANAGLYSVTIIAFGQGGCSDTFTLSTPINIQSSPIANFSYETDLEDVANATVVFTNESTNYTSSYWDFDNGESSTENNPIHDYKKHSDFFVMLVVTNDNGCVDTIELLVKNPLLQGLYVPNAVSPEHSSFEVSHFLPKGIGLKEYHVQIYDDWGNLIWESSLLDDLGRPIEGWDATYKGAPVQQDAYVWKITAVFLDESVWEGKKYPKGKIKRSGTVTVIR